MFVIIDHSQRKASGNMPKQLQTIDEMFGGIALYVQGSVCHAANGKTNLPRFSIVHIAPAHLSRVLLFAQSTELHWPYDDAPLPDGPSLASPAGAKAAISPIARLFTLLFSCFQFRIYRQTQLSTTITVFQ